MRRQMPVVRRVSGERIYVEVDMCSTYSVGKLRCAFGDLLGLPAVCLDFKTSAKEEPKSWNEMCKYETTLIVCQNICECQPGKDGRQYIWECQSCKGRAYQRCGYDIIYYPAGCEDCRARIDGIWVYLQSMGDSGLRGPEPSLTLLHCGLYFSPTTNERLPSHPHHPSCPP